jgi:hypothetical protein
VGLVSLGPPYDRGNAFSPTHGHAKPWPWHTRHEEPYGLRNSTSPLTKS